MGERRRGRASVRVAAAVITACFWVGPAALGPAQERRPIGPHLGIPRGGGPIDPGPVPTGLDSLEPAACGRCHARHYREWASSAHARSFDNPLFDAEYNLQPRAFCDNCHAPRVEASVGVDCAVCHVRGGAVLNPTVSGRAPHASRVAPEVAGTLACARCHDFAFEREATPLQATVAEWLQSSHRGEPCQSCHLPARGPRHSHGLPGGLSPALARDAIAVEVAATRAGAGARVTLRLSADGAGHAVPTGDVFRVLVVSAWAAGRPEAVARVELARRFRVDEDGHHEVEDSRVPATGAREVTLELERAGARVRWAVDLLRSSPERIARVGLPPDQASMRLTQGVVRVAP